MNQESIGMSNITNKLNGKNYLLWSTTVRIFLRVKGKEKHIIQSPPLSDEKNVNDWARDDAQIMAWPWNSM